MALILDQRHRKAAGRRRAAASPPTLMSLMPTAMTGSWPSCQIRQGIMGGVRMVTEPRMRTSTATPTPPPPRRSSRGDALLQFAIKGLRQASGCMMCITDGLLVASCASLACSSKQSTKERLRYSEEKIRTIKPSPDLDQCAAAVARGKAFSKLN